MKPEPVFRSAAVVEYHDAVAWYESRGHGLGARLADAVEATIDRIMADPEFFATIRGDVRDAPVVVFHIESTSMFGPAASSFWPCIM